MGRTLKAKIFTISNHGANKMAQQIKALPTLKTWIQSLQLHMAGENQLLQVFLLPMHVLHNILHPQHIHTNKQTNKL